MYDANLEHIFSYSADLNPDFEVIGNTPEGLRINLYVTGGEVTGSKVQGKFRPGGGDWSTLRPDGVLLLDVRGTIETHDGALIYVTYNGLGDMGEEGYQRFVDGDPVLRFPLHCAPRFLTSHPDYLWLNRLQCVNIGEGDLSAPTATYDVYAIR